MRRFRFPTARCGNRWVAILCRVLVAVGGLAGSATADTKIVAITGQSVPGTGGGTYTSLFDPVLNGNGQVAFAGSATGTTNGSSFGVFRGDGTTMAAIVRDKQAAPGAGGGTFNAAFSSFLSLNDAGQVGFTDNFTSATDGSSVGTFRGDGTTLVALSRDRQAAPGAGGGTFQGIYPNPVLNAAGQGAFGIGLTATTDTSVSGLFRSDGVTTITIVRDKQAAPGTGGGTFAANAFSSSTPAISDNGQVAFSGSLSGTTDSSFSGVFRGNGTILSAIARQNGSAPGAGGGTYLSNFGGVLVNASGQVAFFDNITGASDGSARGLFRGDGSSTLAIARQNQPAPGTGGGLFTSSFDLNDAMNDAGQIAFLGALAGTGNGSTRGIFRGDGTTLDAIVRDKDIAPGSGGGAFSAFGVTTLNATGTVAFFANLTGTTDASTSGVFLADPRERIAVVRDKQALSGSTISSLELFPLTDTGGRNYLNDAGQVAYKATLADGRQVVALFTPQLHYRSTASGSWDDSSNFTVGLTPAAVHDVFIDPAIGLTATGPSAAVAVKNLSVGGTGTALGTAVLNLNAGGSLSVANAVTVSANGELDIANGTLSAVSVTNGGLVRQTGGTVVTGGSILAVLDNTGLYVLQGGTISSRVVNRAGAELQLAGSAATVNGGVSNFGLLDGAGRVTGTLGVAAGGEVRVVGNDRLTFTAASNSNAGRITLANGGTVEFTQDLSNIAGGVIGGRGTLIARAGLANTGQVSLSGGFTDVYGPVNNNAGGKIIVTGGGTTTFYDPVTLNAGSNFQVSAASNAVFLAPVSAVAGAFTGPGTKYFEAGQSSAGPIAAGGVTVVESGAALTTEYLREQSVTVSGKLNTRPNALATKVDSLTINTGGALDLSNNALVIDYAPAAASPIASVRSAIVAGQITSSALTASTAIGYAEASDLPSPATGPFAGLVTDGTAVLVRYTLVGDANLDGAVDFLDLARLAQSYNVTDGKRQWANGDNNYDGNVDFLDLAKLAQNYNTALLPAEPIPGASAAFDVDLARAFASVPEPSLMTIAAVAVLGLAKVRRNKR